MIIKIKKEPIKEIKKIFENLLSATPYKRSERSNKATPSQKIEK